MRMGRVRILDEYIVDLDNEAMVGRAKEALIEDIFTAVKFNEVLGALDIVEEETLTEADIPEFLRDDIGEER